MTGTQVERHRPPELAAHEWAGLERTAKQMAASGLVPDYFRGKPNEIMIAGLALRDLHVALTISTLKQVYVVKGRPGYMAQLQIGILARHGYDLMPVDSECDDKSATVEIEARDRTKHRVTFTMDNALQANLPSQNPTYKTYPAAMLYARACTKAIGQFHPGLLLGLGPADQAEHHVADPSPRSDDTFTAEPRLSDDATGPSVPHPADSPVAPRLPPLVPRLEDQATKAERRAVIALIESLDDDARAALFTMAKAAQIPYVKGARFTHAHCEQLLDMIEVEAIRSRREAGPAAGEPVVAPPAGAIPVDDAGGAVPAQAAPPPPPGQYPPGDPERPFE
jgi:hypothetical protein